MKQSFELIVNRETVRVEAEPDVPLLHVLRNELDLRGSRFGCGLGQCGACFVLMDGEAVPSCDTPMWSAEGRTVVTVEALMADGGLHDVQRRIIEEQAAQCGFCISGIVISAAALIEKNPEASEGDVIEALDRNLCRCGVQPRLVRAVVTAARGERTVGSGEREGG